MPDPTIPPEGGYAYPPGPPVQDPVRPLGRQGGAPIINPGFIAPDLGQSYLQPSGPPPITQPKRPGTAAPYPSSSRPGSAGPGGFSQQRPMSAVGYGPQPRIPSGVQATNRRYSAVIGAPGIIPPAGTYPTGPPRPFTSMGDAQGRRPTPAGRQPYPLTDGYGSPLNGPGYPGGFNGEPVPHIRTPNPSQMHGNRPPPAGAVGGADIGFEAPPLRPKPAKPPAQSTAGGAQGPHGKPMKRLSGMLGGKQPGQMGPPSGAQGGPPPRPSQTPPSGAQGSPPLRPSQGPPTPPANFSHNQATIPPQPSGQAPKPQSTPLPKPPTKGPKTFDEMGVGPHTQKDQDCVCYPHFALFRII